MVRIAFAVGLILQCSLTAVQAVELTGRYGFIGEWLVAATLTEKALPAGRRELSGRLDMKHMAICGPGEVSLKTGEIAMTLPRSGNRFSARLDLDGSRCDFTGVLSEEAVSFIKCSGQDAIPLRLWRDDGRSAAR